MNVGQLLQTLIVTIIGGIVGGGIATATSWISKRQERETSVKEWYEQKYIINGVDPLIAYFIGLEFRLVNKTEYIAMNVPNDPVPIDSIAGIYFLFGQTMLLETVSLVHWCLDYEKNDRKAKEIGGIVLEVVQVLLKCRDELLAEISTHIRNKLDKVKPTDETIEQLEMICKKLHQLVNHDIKFLHAKDIQHA